MRRKLADGPENDLFVGGTHLDSAPLGRQVERGSEVLAELPIRPGDCQQEGALQHRLEPFDANARVAEDALEEWIEGTQIEERFIDVEDENTSHRSAERVGFEPTGHLTHGLSRSAP